jgi:hypothetical protein
MATINDTAENDRPASPLRLARLPESEPTKPKDDEKRRLQRLRIVRRRQGVSLRAMARHLRTTVVDVRLQELPSADILLSELYRWRSVLEVPIAELVTETPENLTTAVGKRAQLLRLMRTAAQIMEVTDEEPIREMARMLMAELMAVMPELENVSGWHSIGRRRRTDEYGVALHRGLGDSSWRKAA